MDLPCVWDAPRPFVHPVTTPAGAVLSVEAPADHPWHHALWFTIKFVNEENFWEEYGDFGTLRTINVEEAADVVTATLDWIAPDGESIRLRETRTIRTAPIDADAYLIDWSESLSVPVATTLDRTPFTTWGGYGGLTLRGAPTWTDTVLRLADGADRDRCLGDPSPWLSIEGTPTEWHREADPHSNPSRSEERAEASSSGASRATNPPSHPNVRADMEAVSNTPSRSEERAEASSSGASRATNPPSHPSGRAEEEPAGVVIFDHPGNVRAATPWYASTRADTYGEGWANFVNAAFLWHEPLTLAAEETLDLTYRVIVHDGHWESERIQAEYDRWIR